MNQNRAWTEEDSKFLIEHYSQEGPAWCAQRLNRTKRAIYNWAYKLELKAKDGGQAGVEWFPPKQKAAVRRAAGQNAAEIAQKAREARALGLSYGKLVLLEQERVR